jgi:uncharacterized protein YyaL (SSP411 family)
MQWLAYGYKEVVIAGPDAEMNWKSMVKAYLPAVLVTVTGSSSALGLMEGRTGLDKNLIFVCENRACQLPVASVEEGLGMVNGR